MDRSQDTSKTVEQIRQSHRRSYDVREYQECQKCEKTFHIAKITVNKAITYCFSCASKSQQIIQDWAKRLMIPEQTLLSAVNMMKWWNQEVTLRHEIRTLIQKKANKRKCIVCKKEEFNGFPTTNKHCNYVCRRCVFRSNIRLNSMRDLEIQVDNYSVTIDREVIKYFKVKPFHELPSIDNSLGEQEQPSNLEFSIPQPDVDVALEDGDFCARCNICMNHFSDHLKPMKCVCKIDNHIMCEVCLIDYMAGSQMDTKGFLQCPYCRKKEEFKIETPFVQKFLKQFQVDQDTLKLSNKCNIPGHKPKQPQNFSRVVVPGCWAMMTCKSKDHPLERQNEFFLYIGMGDQDFGCLDYKCKFCGSRMYAKSVYFSNCKGMFQYKLQRQKRVKDDLAVPKTEVKKYDLREMQLARMEIFKL